MAKKNFALRADQIKPLAKNRGGCIATDMITVERRKVGYMYREESRNVQDSGWIFTARQESQAYMDDADYHCICDVNTIANCDPDIIPFLDVPFGAAFEWMTAWNNDHGESKGERLAGIKKSASPERFADHESEAKNLTRFRYRLRDENEEGPVESLCGFVIGDDGHLQMGIYFDDPTDEAEARQLVESVAERERTGTG